SPARLWESCPSWRSTAASSATAAAARSRRRCRGCSTRSKLAPDAEVLEADREQVNPAGSGQDQRELQQAIDRRGGAPRVDDVDEQRRNRADGVDDADDAEGQTATPRMNLDPLHNASAFHVPQLFGSGIVLPLTDLF